MDENAERFITEIVKPWESLNLDLGEEFLMNPQINDFTTRAFSLAVSIKHMPEAILKMENKNLITESRSFEILSDLADSYKHGFLRNQNRQSNLVVSSVFERNSVAKVRFLRNKINIEHNTYGKTDFMQCSLESAVFISQKLNVKINWFPKIFNNSGVFSDEIRLHMSNKNQVACSGMHLEFVELNKSGNYVNVDLDGTVKFIIWTADP